MLRSISHAVQNVMSLKEPGIYGMSSCCLILAKDFLCLPSAFSHRPRRITVPPVYDYLPGRFVRHIDFNHFRTIGMRRSIDEGVSSRFVTAERLGAILKVSPRTPDPIIVTGVTVVWLHSDVISIVTLGSTQSANLRGY